jgi:hypothetical protein
MFVVLNTDKLVDEVKEIITPVSAGNGGLLREMKIGMLHLPFSTI